MITENDCVFKCVKITLIILYSLAIIVYVVGLVFSIEDAIASVKRASEYLSNFYLLMKV